MIPGYVLYIAIPIFFALGYIVCALMGANGGD
jgi:hypothetical protein